MKLHFESDLPYQAAAIETVRDLFRGQEVSRLVQGADPVNVKYAI